MDEDFSFEVNSDWLRERQHEGDVMGEVPFDLIQKDVRHSTHFDDELVDGPFRIVDQTLGEIASTEIDGRPLDLHGRVDKGLSECIKRVVYQIYRNNRELKGRSYTDLELKILVREMWHVDHLHGVPDYGQKERHDGSSYSRGHLFGSLLNGIILTGITDLAFLLALLHHDDLEDLKEIHIPGEPPAKEKLMTVEPRVEKMGVVPEEHGVLRQDQYLRDLRKRLFGLVRGVTNISALDRSKLDEEFFNTVDLIDKMLTYEPMVMAVRFCERVHNLSTLKGMRKVGKDASADMKITESLARYAPIALILGLRDVYKTIVQACFADANPEAVQDFNLERDSRLTTRLDSTGDTGAELNARLLEVRQDPAVVYLAFRPKPFFEPEYCDTTRVFDKGYKPSADLNELDPLFRIEVLVEEESELEEVRTKLTSALTRGSRTGVHQRRGILYIHNPSLGRRIEVRLRTVREARVAQRGIFDTNRNLGTSTNPSYALEAKKTLPENLKARIQRFFGMINKDTPVTVLRDLIREILLQELRVVVTPEEDAIELPSTATVVDFARAISRRTLALCVGATRLDNPSVGAGVRLEPFDRIFPKGFSEADSETDPMIEVLVGEEMKLTPGWSTYTSEPHTLNSISHQLDEQPDSVQERLGHEHIEEVAVLLDLSAKEVTALLSSLHPAFSIPDLYKLVGTSDIKPLELLSNKVDEKDGINFEVDLPNGPGDLLRFLTRFARPFINLVILDGQSDYKTPSGLRTKIQLRFETISGAQVPLYELLRLAYQIGRVYPIKVTSTRFRRLVDSLPPDATGKISA